MVEGEEMKEGQERRELCPYCSRPLMKSRRMKFQGGEWRCAHCGAPWPGTLELDEDVLQNQEEQDQPEKPVEETVDDSSLME
jgi:ribosomal protein L37AE/L43A